MAFKRNTLEVDIILDHEIASFLAQAIDQSIRDYTMITLALNTGLRNSEIVGLDVQDIKPYGIITNILDVPERIIKGNMPRSIPLRDDLKTILKLFLLEKDSQKEPVFPDSPLFCSKYTHNRLASRDFQRIVNLLSIKAFNRMIHPHTLRHTFATKLLEKSNIRVVQQVLGHKNLQSTMIYTHPSKNVILEAINEI